MKLPFCYSASVMCMGCGGIGDPHWVDVNEGSATYGLCTRCRIPKDEVTQSGMTTGDNRERVEQLP